MIVGIQYRDGTTEKVIVDFDEDQLQYVIEKKGWLKVKGLKHGRRAAINLDHVLLFLFDGDDE